MAVGGEALYSAGGSLMIANNDEEYGELWSPDFFEVGYYTVTLEVKSAGDEDYFIVDFMDWDDNDAYEFLDCSNEWSTVSVTIDCLSLNAADGLYFVIYSDYYDLYIRNIEVSVESPAILPPVALAATEFDGESFVANWEETEGATSYLLTVWPYDPELGGLGDPILENKEVEGTSYRVEGIEPGVVYAYGVIATDGENNSSMSKLVEVAELLDVENLTAVAKKDLSGIDLKWDAVPGANYYTIDWAECHKAAADETYSIGTADFSSLESTGTLEAPELSNYWADTYPELPHWDFVLAQTIPGAVGVESFWLYEWFGYVAALQSKPLDLSGAVDGKVKIKMSVSSSMNSTFAAGIYSYDEEEESYMLAGDPFFFDEPLTTEFTDVEFELDGASEDCIIQILPLNANISYADEEDEEEEEDTEANLYFQSFSATIDMVEGGEVTLPFETLGTEGNDTYIDFAINANEEYYVSVAPYTLAEDDGDLYVLIEGNPCEPVVVTMPSGIDNIAADSNASAVYYNLQGIRVNKPVAGHIYVRVQGNKAAKVIVK